MYNNQASPTVTNCTFSGNSTSFLGGGMYNVYSSSPMVSNCTFSDNSSNAGGGMFNSSSSSPTVTSCTFSGNSADSYGGGMNNTGSSPMLTNCTFSGNSAGMYGGALYNGNLSSPTLTNCILWGDTASSSPEIRDASGTSTVTYSNVQGGFTGDGNINADPLFVDDGNGDYRLDPGSPCIDAANGPVAPDYDQDGYGRVDDPDSPNNGIGPPWADMGAYEFQPSWWW